MPKHGLEDLVKADKPLIEVTIALAEGVDAESMIHELNKLADDFEASLSVYCAISGVKDFLSADATPEALQRLFGWEIKRVNLERWDPESQRYEGVWDHAYRWEEMNKPTRFPSCLEGRVKEIGLSQPGTNDNGKAYP